VRRTTDAAVARRGPVRAGAALALILGLAGLASAQPAIAVDQALDFDRPESWAMKYFATVSVPTTTRAPQPMAAGAVDVGFEGGLVPRLDDEKRRVGFNGTKLEDVNKTRLFGRIRGRIGLPSAFSVDVGYVPPIEVNGARPHLFSAAAGRTFTLSDAWHLDLRAHAQLGTIRGDITCSADEAAAGPDPSRNPFLCDEPSSDRLEQRMAGGEISVGRTAGRWHPYAGLSFDYLDLEFRVHARYAGIVDRTRQTTSGGAVGVLGGLGFVPAGPWRLSGEVFYAPLSVVRPPDTRRRNDALFNARFLLSYRLR
jgi:hypothetical protein